MAHISVLKNEAVEALHIKPNGVYVDATFGAGGHSLAILEKLQRGGRLYAFDADKSVEEFLPKQDERFCFVHQNFRYLQRYLRVYGVGEVDGILADLGISSLQLDAENRGFSARYDSGELDMRMNLYQDLRVSDWLRKVGREELREILAKYGDLPNATKVARLLVEARESKNLQTVGDLKNALRACVQGNPNRYYARVFQALRMVINEELEALEELLNQAEQLLVKGGRLAIISFHSGEDRVVKHFLRNSSQLQVVNKKPICPSETEIITNKRSRSAKLRIAEKV